MQSGFESVDAQEPNVMERFLLQMPEKLYHRVVTTLTGQSRERESVVA